MMIKLHYLFKVKTDSDLRSSGWLTSVLIILLYFGGMSSTNASNGVDNFNSVEDSKTILEDLTNNPKIVRSYNITDASTEGKSCFPTKGKGVIFQRADGCQGSHHIWSVADKLTMNEYDNDTATIVGSVIDDNGKIGKVNIALYNKSNQGNTWQAQCYQDGITDPRSLYQSFNGTITVEGQAFSIELKQAQQHYIVADGAGFEPGQFGFGAWTGGSFGGCTEWFGNLDPIEVNCDLTVDAGEDQGNCNIEEIVLTANAENASDCSNIISSYKIIDSNTEPGCFSADPGVIFTKGQNCSESLIVWSAKDDLELNEYDDNTAKITGSVINQYGKTGIVDIKLTDKEHSGTTWSASCYLDGISGQETFYRSFNGTITVDGAPLTVGTRFNAHYILANGAGFDSSQYGLGAWTGGSFGSCAEWFGNLVPKTIDNSNNELNYVWSTTDGNIVGDSNQQTITVNKAGTYTVKATDCEDCEAIDTVVITELPGPTVDAGEDIEVCNEDTVELTAEASDVSECVGGCEYPIESIARCNDSSNLSDVWLANITGANRGFVTSSSKFETSNNGTARYTAIGSNGIDNIEVDISFSGYTTTAPQDSPKENNCGTYDTTDWVYWTNTSGTIKTQNHGTLTVSRAGPSMQLGNGADVTRNGFGASGWLTISGGDGFYTAGDVNLKLGECIPIPTDSSVDYIWTTTDGNIVGDANQKTITVDKSGTYTATVKDCETCEGSDSVVVTMNEVKADAGNDQVICKGDEAILTATGGGTYLWSTGETTAIIKVSPEVETTYSVTVTSDEGCESTDDVIVNLNSDVKADAGVDQTICEGEEVSLTVMGEGTYLWSTGEITQSITVNPEVTTEYSVIVTNGNCEAMDDVVVNVDDKVLIGDYAWLDENRNGMQDDGATGIKGMSVKLYHCNGDLVDSTTTNDDGYYQFELCPGTGDYNVVFGDVPDGLKFTASNQGNPSTDSNADAGGVTACFTITDKDDLTIDAGLIEICDINLEVIEEIKMCGEQVLELTATLTDNTEECEGGCVYPIIEQERCYGPEGDFEIWMWSVTDGKKKYHKFKASEQRFETLDDGSARYTATASDGIDTIEVNAMFTDYTTVPGPNGPKPNDCQQYDMSDWEYWSTWSGTITSQNHGVFTLSMKGTYFQMGVGADVTRSGFGASGWFFATGGDGYYTDGDINVALEECIEKSATFEWTTQDGNINSDANQKTITIDRAGTYVIEATNCIDCVAVKKIVVTEDILCATFAKSGNTPKMMKMYPVPVKSGGTLTIEFDLEDNKNVSGLEATSLKAAVSGNSKKENVVIVLYDMTGRVISTPRTFDIVGGKAVIYLDLEYMPTGKYIVKAMSGTWNDSKNIIVR